MANSSDADVILKLYDLRREAEIHKERNWWFAAFWPEGSADFTKGPQTVGTAENNWLRQVPGSRDPGTGTPPPRHRERDALLGIGVQRRDVPPGVAQRRRQSLFPRPFQGRVWEGIFDRERVPPLLDNAGTRRLNLTFLNLFVRVGLLPPDHPRGSGGRIGIGP